MTWVDIAFIVAVCVVVLAIGMFIAYVNTHARIIYRFEEEQRVMRLFEKSIVEAKRKGLL